MKKEADARIVYLPSSAPIFICDISILSSVDDVPSGTKQSYITLFH